MEETLQTALMSAKFEIEFERAKQKAESIYEDERARMLRVELLLQEYVNDELQEHLEQVQDVDLKRSEDLVDDLHGRLADLEEQYEQTQTELKTCLRDIDQYQTEINAMNVAASDTTRLLTEKLALSRELNTLKPELEHLRSQATSHQNILADKLSLQRELATVQVELDTEKRAVQRLKQQNSNDATLNEELEDLKQQLIKERKQVHKFERQIAKQANETSTAHAAFVDELEAVKQELEESKTRAYQAERRLAEATTKNNTAEVDTTAIQQLRTELTKERKALQRNEREQLKKSTEWDTEKEILETKVDAFRNKLRSTKEQLKEAQDELERREQAKFAESAAATKARIRGQSAEPTQNQILNPRKRHVARFDPDMTIGTPGNGGPAAKKSRMTGSNIGLGDKSTFSITPFLNRTLSVLPESPNAVMNITINELAEEAEQEDRASKEKDKEVKTRKPTAATKKSVVEKKTSAVAKSKATAPLKEAGNRANALGKAPALDKVVEEDDNQANPSVVTDQPTISIAQSIEVSEATTLQPKKKKLLGARKNIFDDDEPDGIKKSSAAGLGKVKLGLGKNKPRMLAEFSPLKQDRRMTGAVGA